MQCNHWCTDSYSANLFKLLKFEFQEMTEMTPDEFI